MSELFRKVLTKDRLPDEEGVYDTARGRLLFQKGSFYDNQYSLELDGNHFAPVNPQYWYEYVLIPTDDEIEKMAFGKYGTADYVFHRRNGYITGFESALKYMEGKS